MPHSVSRSRLNTLWGVIKPTKTEPLENAGLGGLNF